MFEGSHGGGRQRGTAALRAGTSAREAVTIAAPGQAESEESSHCIRKVFSLSLHRWHTDTGFLSKKGFEWGRAGFRKIRIAEEFVGQLLDCMSRCLGMRINEIKVVQVRS